MDGSEYANAKPEERLSNPRAYFKKLEKLEKETYNLSRASSEGAPSVLQAWIVSALIV
jgi:hypothetical protein